MAFITFIHIAACVLLVIFVLLQQGKGSALSVFGGGGGDVLFSGSSGTSFLKKITLGCAITVAVTSLLLTMFAAGSGMKSVTQQYPMQRQAQASPAQAQKGEQAAPVQPVGGLKPAARQPGKTK